MSLIPAPPLPPPPCLPPPLPLLPSPLLALALDHALLLCRHSAHIATWSRHAYNATYRDAQSAINARFQSVDHTTCTAYMQWDRHKTIKIRQLSYGAHTMHAYVYNARGRGAFHVCGAECIRSFVSSLSFTVNRSADATRAARQPGLRRCGRVRAPSSLACRREGTQSNQLCKAKTVTIDALGNDEQDSWVLITLQYDGCCSPLHLSQREQADGRSLDAVARNHILVIYYRMLLSSGVLRAPLPYRHRRTRKTK
eukprot:1024709-Prorocentrum_minimum.AAC.3